MAQMTLDEFKKRFDFNWETLDIILRGKSVIDSRQGARIESLEEADLYISRYGIDLQNPIEKGEVFGNFHESINFIRKNFLAPDNPEGLKLEIPRRIVELTDVRDLFLMANFSYPSQSRDTQGIYLRDWACSILKVMHTVAHIDQDVKASYFSEVQKQILDRYYKIIHRDDTGKLYLGFGADDPGRVNLVAFETKPKKSRESTLIKLLHKAENVAEDIFDRVGIRFITHTRIDALRVVAFLKSRMIFMPPNLKPSRSKNTLIHFDRLKNAIQEIRIEIENSKLSEERIIQRLEEECSFLTDVEPLGSVENPHSSEFYRSIQFTVRQLIKLSNPLHKELKELKQWAKALSSRPVDPSAGEVDDVVRLIERMDLKYIQKEARFFYPYEVQLMDEKSFHENERGRSAHSEYKRAQLLTAIKRVMGPLMEVQR